MFRLGRRHMKVAQVPEIDMLTENNARQGFIEQRELRALLKELPHHHAAWVQFDYYAGWRVASEVLTRQWKHVDLNAGWIRLEPGETKNGKAREFPLDHSPRLTALLKLQWERKHQIECERNVIIPWVFFQPNGKPIRSFKNAWATAGDRAHLPHLIPHDYRRTAVRNLNRAGVAKSTAMALVGHETAEVFERYSIKDEAQLKEAVGKVSELHASTPKEPETKVANLFRRSAAKVLV